LCHFFRAYIKNLVKKKGTPKKDKNKQKALLFRNEHPLIVSHNRNFQKHNSSTPLACDVWLYQKEKKKAFFFVVWYFYFKNKSLLNKYL
jgi:hypothetical protein